MNEINYVARTEGLEGKVYYQNLLNSAEYVKLYFPVTPGETTNEYARRPKISVPITSSIIDRITNILLQGAVITTSSKESQDRLDELTTDLQLVEFVRDMITNAIVTGNNLSLIRIVDNMMKIENWTGEWVWMKNGLSGYEYTIKDETMVPVLSDSVKDTTVVVVDDVMFGDVTHNLGYTPSTLLKNIDKYDDGVWGKSFVMRFDTLVLEYCHIVSQISKSIKILQNVWVSNRDIDNPEQPIRLSPDRINFLGVDGTLEQAIRNLDLKEEREYLNILEHQISRASQCPAELSGLKDVGKLPSGIALQLLLQPLTELTERMKNSFIPAVEDFIWKILATDYTINNQPIPTDLDVTIQTNDSVLPEDRTAQIAEIITLKNEGLINENQARILLEPIIGIDLGNTEEL